MEQTMSNLTDLEIARLKENGQFTVCKPQKSSSKTVIKSKLHYKKKRSNHGRKPGPSTNVVSGIYNTPQLLKKEHLHRSINPLMAQQNRAVEPK
jgi:hypothetical protein